MNDFRADLHCHTTFSDGSLTPPELIALAKKIGLQGLCITDHDTVAAYASAIPAATAAGLLLGAGVEFSCHHCNTAVHILGYDFDLADHNLLAFTRKHQTRRAERNQQILSKLAERAMPLRLEDLNGIEVIGRPHIAQAMLAKGYVTSVQEAFNLYLADGRCCYASGAVFTVEETLSVIQQAGGKAFLAHPHLLQDGRFLRELLKLPFNGIECYYARCSPEKERRFLKIAKSQNLLVSGGSDFHGAVKAQIPLGCSWVDAASFNKIFQRPLCG